MESEVSQCSRTCCKMKMLWSWVLILTLPLANSVAMHHDNLSVMSSSHGGRVSNDHRDKAMSRGININIH